MKNRILIVFELVLLATITLGFVSAQKIYLSNSCDNLSPCYSNLSEAISYANNNDEIIIKSGEYFVDILKIEKNINIKGEDKENTIFYPSADTTCCFGDSQAWFLVNKNVIFNVNNITFDGSGKKISQVIRSFGSGVISNNVFRNIHWSDNQGAAIVAFGGDTTINENSFSKIGRNSIWVGSYYTTDDSGVNIPVAGNNYQITNNNLEGKGECDCIDRGIEIGAKTSNTTISGNEIFNYEGRYSAEQSYSMGIFAWNIAGETLSVEIYNNSIHKCIIPIFLKNQGDTKNQVNISKNNMKDNEFDGLNINYNQDSIINFEGLNSNSNNSSFSSMPDYLFDIKMEILKNEIKSSEPLIATLKFENFGTKSTTAHVNYIILDEYNKEAYSESEDITVETEQVITKTFENLNLARGEYTLYVKIDYNNVTDNFKQGFTVEGAQGKVDTSAWVMSSKGRTDLFFIGGILVIGILLILYLRYKKSRNKKNSQRENKKT